MLMADEKNNNIHMYQPGSEGPTNNAIISNVECACECLLGDGVICEVLTSHNC